MDLNGDGYLDMLSGSWPGEIFFFEGGPDQTFASPIMLEDKQGELINFGGGMEESRNGGLLITGHAEFEETAEGTFVNYRGKKFKTTPERQVSVTGSASAVHAADWDGDGDFDLLIGNIGGELCVVPNEGNVREYAFGTAQPLEVDGKPIRIQKNTSPYAADWDSDGDLDLLVGLNNGAVVCYENIGSIREPKLKSSVQLLPSCSISYDSTASIEPRRGIRSRICVTDWNGDGKLDLLVGDFTTQKPDLPEPSPQDKLKHEELRKAKEEVMKRMRRLQQKLYGPDAVQDEKEYEKLKADLDAVYEQYSNLESQLPREYDNHGWIWLFLRK